MSTVGQREIHTQRRVIEFFKNDLGYTYLGNWKDRLDNSNVEKTLLTDWLKRQGHNDKDYHQGVARDGQGGSTKRQQDSLRRQP